MLKSGWLCPEFGTHLGFDERDETRATRMSGIVLRGLFKNGEIGELSKIVLAGLQARIAPRRARNTVGDGSLRR